MNANINKIGKIPRKTPKLIVAVDKIYNNICPANMFAKSRTLRLIGRIKNEIISITTNRGNNQPGTFEGKNILKKLRPSVEIPTIIQPKKKLKAKNKVKAICAVIVKVYGNKPTRFAPQIKLNSPNRIGKNLTPFLPVCSIIKFKIN
jgi:hypothetical protein